MTKPQKTIVTILAVALALIWAARVIEAVSQRSAMPPFSAMEGVARAYRWQIDRIDANARIAGAAVPFIGGPIYRARTNRDRAEFVESLRAWEEIDARMERYR